MKNVVTLDEIREVEIRSQDIYDRYLHLLSRDIPLLIAGLLPEERTTCPGCHGTSYQDQFEKLGFRYRTCNACGTMFVSKRPSDAAILRYYNEAESHRFFVQEYLRGLGTSAGSRLLRARLEWLLDSIAEYDSPRRSFLDQRSKYPSFLDRVREEGGFDTCLTARSLVDPLPIKFEDRGPLRQYSPGSLSVITAFEFLDTLYEPDMFGRDSFRALEPDGLLFITTRTVSGFDIQMLWSESKSILPPNHVTLFSIEGLITFFQRHGFLVRELSTPGQLDLEIVARWMAEKGAGGGRGGLEAFIGYLVEKRDKDAQLSFKEFLQRNRLSSHARLVLQKPRSKETNGL